MFKKFKAVPIFWPTLYKPAMLRPRGFVNDDGLIASKVLTKVLKIRAEGLALDCCMNETVGKMSLADLTGGHTCSGRRGPCPKKGPGGPMGGVLRRSIKCHVTAAKRKTCIANKSSAVNRMGDRLATIDMGRKFGGVKLGGVYPFFGGAGSPVQHNMTGAEAYLHAKFHLGRSNRLATIHQHHRQTDSTDGTGQTGQTAVR